MGGGHKTPRPLPTPAYIMSVKEHEAGENHEGLTLGRNIVPNRRLRWRPKEVTKSKIMDLGLLKVRNLQVSRLQITSQKFHKIYRGRTRRTRPAQREGTRLPKHHHGISKRPEWQFLHQESSTPGDPCLNLSGPSLVPRYRSQARTTTMAAAPQECLRISLHRNLPRLRRQSRFFHRVQYLRKLSQVRMKQGRIQLQAKHRQLQHHHHH